MSRLRTAAGLLVPALSVLAASAVMPTCQVGSAAAGAIVFGGATIAAVLGVALAARDPRNPQWIAPIAALLWLVALLRAGAPSAWVVALVASSLVAVSVGLGTAIGLRVQKAGHFLPAAAMAAAADVFSLTSQLGPSHAIADSPRALSLLAVSFPVPGTRVFAPALGVGDLVFIALALGVARAHALPYLRVCFAGYLGVAASGALSAWLAMPIPALPAIGFAIVLTVPATRVVSRADRTPTVVAVGLALVAIVWAVLRARTAR